MGCGIYKIENIKNGKIYIGSSIDIESRKYKHFWMLHKSLHYNQHLQKSYNKHGKSAFKFSIIEECLFDDLINKENHYITLYSSNKQNNGYNLATVNEFRRNNFNGEVKKKIISI